MTRKIGFFLDPKQNVSDIVVSRVRRNGKVLLMTLLMTPIFYFHYLSVISALTTPSFDQMAFFVLMSANNLVQVLYPLTISLTYGYLTIIS